MTSVAWPHGQDCPGCADPVFHHFAMCPNRGDQPQGEASTDWRPWAIIAKALTAHSLGEPVDEDEVESACALLVATVMVQAGVPRDVVVRLFDERPYETRIACDVESGELSVDVTWMTDDGEVTTRCWRCDAVQGCPPLGLCEPCRDDLITTSSGGHENKEQYP